MKLTEQEVRNVAELANLALANEEIGKMTHDLDEILTHIDKLNELDTSDVQPAPCPDNDKVPYSASCIAFLKGATEIGMQWRATDPPASTTAPQ